MPVFKIVLFQFVSSKLCTFNAEFNFYKILSRCRHCEERSNLNTMLNMKIASFLAQCRLVRKPSHIFRQAQYDLRAVSLSEPALSLTK